MVKLSAGKKFSNMEKKAGLWKEQVTHIVHSWV